MKNSDYIITSNYEIAQIIDIKEQTILTDIGPLTQSQIIDSNPSLSKLIHEGDFVNGSRVYKSKGSPNLFVNGHSLLTYDIVQVMTKEYFFQHCYAPNSNKSDIPIQWKQLSEFPEYEISTTGLVRVIKSGKILSYLKDNSKLTVRFASKDGPRPRRHVANLVLETFDSPSQGRLPKYKDNNPDNCNIYNLYWETPEEMNARLSPKPRALPKYHHIIGYIGTTPIIYAFETPEMLDKIIKYCPAITVKYPALVSNSIRTNKPYKHLQFKMIPEDEYNEIIKSIDLQQANQLYTDYYQLMLKSKEKPLPKPKKERTPKPKKEPTPKVVKPKTTPKPIKPRSIDLIDDADFYKEQEERKRNEFKAQLLKRLGK